MGCYTCNQVLCFVLIFAMYFHFPFSSVAESIRYPIFLLHPKHRNRLRVCELALQGHDFVLNNSACPFLQLLSTSVRLSQ